MKNDTELTGVQKRQRKRHKIHMSQIFCIDGIKSVTNSNEISILEIFEEKN